MVAHNTERIFKMSDHAVGALGETGVNRAYNSLEDDGKIGANDGKSMIYKMSEESVV